MITLLQQKESSNLADLSCGTGRVTSKLIPIAKQITAIDPNEAAIQYAKHKYTEVGNINWIIGDKYAINSRSKV